VLQRPAELKAMTAAALGVGLTPRNILEVFMQSGLYAGFGTTAASAEIAREVFATKGLTVPAYSAVWRICTAYSHFN
jgi:alkylhydroperoxidase/carboxymuconolactone decarboxylase family protein YurZ